MLKKEYYNIFQKTKRYLQINITNDKIELSTSHNEDYRKQFYTKYKEEIEYLCNYIKENKYYEKIKCYTHNKKVYINLNIINYTIKIDNKLEMNCLFKNVTSIDLNECFNITCNNNKILKKIKKGNINIYESLTKILIKEQEISPKILDEIKQLNNPKIKKKKLDLPKIK